LLEGVNEKGLFILSRFHTNYFSPGKNLNTRQQVIITMLKETEEVVEKEFNVDEC
jgi:hypothetical protein